MARIGIQSWGSQGDVQPFLALAEALAARKHDVVLVLATNPEEHYTVSEGIELVRVDGDIDTLSGAEIIERVVELSSPIEQLKLTMREGFEPLAQAMTEAAEDLTARSDLVVRHHFLHMTQAMALRAKIPEASVFLSPDLIPTRQHPPTGMPSVGPLNRAAWWMMARVLGRVLMPPARELRAKLELPEPNNVLRDVWLSDDLNFAAASPTLFSRPTDWPEHYHLTGFWRGPATTSIPLEPELEAFLSTGAPPLYVSFGSMMPYSEDRLEATLELMQSAARALEQRVILQIPPSSSASLRQRFAAQDTLLLERSPHALVFPRCAAVLHHGGAGTAQTVLRAGTPSLVIPHLADQFFWGPQLARLGAGRCTPARAKLTSKKLVAELKALLEDDSIRKRAAALGEQLDGEDGLTHAVEAIEALLDDQATAS